MVLFFIAVFYTAIGVRLGHSTFLTYGFLMFGAWFVYRRLTEKLVHDENKMEEMIHHSGTKS